jgi:two-component system, probable response regulator PhcQ
MSYKILLVDDDAHVISSLKRALHKEPYQILSANTAAEALTVLAEENIDLLVSDEMMPGMKGAELLAVVSRKYPRTIRIMLTGHATLETAIKAINEGRIYRFLTKPWNDVDLAVTLRQALEHRTLVMENRRLNTENQRQEKILAFLEQKYPGIATVERDTQGNILLTE